MSSGAWHLQETLPRCLGPHPLPMPAGRPEACVADRMKVVSRQSEQIQRQVRNTADAELVNRWAEKVTHAKQLGLYAQSLNGGREK